MNLLDQLAAENTFGVARGRGIRHGTNIHILPRGATGKGFVRWRCVAWVSHPEFGPPDAFLALGYRFCPACFGKAVIEALALEPEAG